VDSIVGFVAADDTIQLDKTIFAKFTTTGAIQAGQFVAGANALDSNDYLVYDSGSLYYDADGNGGGAKVLFATLTGAPALTAADFSIVA
jgi:Ca2+-binding RTX toxin-like protein